jgi:hypothetical protein
MMLGTLLRMFVCAFASSNAFAFVIQKSSHRYNNNKYIPIDAIIDTVDTVDTVGGRHRYRYRHRGGKTKAKTMRAMIPSDVVDLDLLLATTSHAFVATPLHELAPASLSVADTAITSSTGSLTDAVFTTIDVATTTLDGTVDATVTVDVDAAAATARAEFYFFFFAGSGAGGIGATQLPKFVRYVADNRALAGVGPTLGGNQLALPQPLALSALVYPTLCERDVAAILNQLPDAETIVARGNSEGYLASKGYIVRDDFDQALEGCNPLARSATYDALTRGTGDVLSPVVFRENLERYRCSGTDALVADLQAAVWTKLGAFSALSFLLAGLAWVIVVDAKQGFFGS